MDRNIYCLCIGVEAYFYGLCITNPNFGIEARRWHNSKVSVWLVLSGLEIPILPTGHQTLHVGK